MANTHDYTVRCVGHDFNLTPYGGGQYGKMSGWGHGIEKGDFLILPMPDSKKTTRYRVVKIRYMVDPPDQWFADVVFAPRMRKELPDD